MVVGDAIPADVDGLSRGSTFISSRLYINTGILVTGRNIIVDGDEYVVNVNWEVSGASSVIIDNGIGLVGSIGTSQVTIDYPGGIYPFNITATDGVNTLTDTIFGKYDFVRRPVTPPSGGGGGEDDTDLYNDISVCEDRFDMVKTYGLDELKFGTDRDINLVTNN